MELLVRNRIFRTHTIRYLGGKRSYTYRNADFRRHSWQKCKQASVNSSRPLALFLQNRQQSFVPVCTAFVFPTREFSTHSRRSNYYLVAYDNEDQKRRDKLLLPSALVQCGTLALCSQQRSLSISRVCAEKSKVEQSVQALKDQPGKAPPKPPLWKRVVDELVHTYHGFRLLFIDMRVSLGLAFRVLIGKTLTRREHKLLVRTTSDVFRLIPFSVFVIVPFMEFLLPVYLWLFPGALPSTFQTKDEKTTKLKNQLKVKLEVAKFLQETLEEMSLKSSGSRSSESAEEFKEFFKRVIRTSGQTPSNADILKFSKAFGDEITLDKLPRGHLVALCRLLELHSIGPTSFLTFQLRMALRNIKADDLMIHKEGVNALTVWELQQAMKARGMKSIGLSEIQMRDQLNKWLDLSMRDTIPPSLLLLSRAMASADDVPGVDQIGSTISQLPEVVGTEAQAHLAEMEGKVDPKIRALLIKEEQKRIKEERKEMAHMEKEKMVDKAPFMDPLSPKDEISEKEINAIEGAVDSIALEKKKLLLEKEELQDLKEEMAEYREDIDELQAVKKLQGRAPRELTETRAAQRLYGRLNKMIGKIDGAIYKAEASKVSLQSKVDQGVAEKEELISITELINSMRKMQSVPNEARLSKIEDVLARMDIDKDGNIKVDDVVKVFQILGQEHASVTPSQMKVIVEMLEKEDLLESGLKVARPPIQKVSGS